MTNAKIMIFGVMLAIVFVPAVQSIVASVNSDKTGDRFNVIISIVAALILSSVFFVLFLYVLNQMNIAVSQ